MRVHPPPYVIVVTINKNITQLELDNLNYPNTNLDFNESVIDSTIENSSFPLKSKSGELIEFYDMDIAKKAVDSIKNFYSYYLYNNVYLERQKVIYKKSKGNLSNKKPEGLKFEDGGYAFYLQVKDTTINKKNSYKKIENLSEEDLIGIRKAQVVPTCNCYYTETFQPTDINLS
jgi:hypothetical protein